MLYEFESMPENKECKRFTSGTEEDRNIFVVRDGLVRECYKGIPDEVNNELYTNYSLHKQNYPLPIKHKIMRCVPVRVVVALKSLLIKLRRITEYREAVVDALQSRDVNHYMSTLKSINYTKLEEELSTDDWKYTAFHLLQTYSLIMGKEFYTKKDIAKYYPDMKLFLYREKERYSHADLTNIENLKNQFLAAIKLPTVTKKGDLALFSIDQCKGSNHFHAQSNGTIVDVVNERLVFFSYCFHSSSLSTPDWPLNDLPPLHNSTWIGAFNYNGKVMLSVGNSFESPLIKKALSLCRKDTQFQQKLSQLLQMYYCVLTLEDNEIVPILKIHNISLNISSITEEE